MKTILATLLSAAAVLSAADRKIVINAVDNHNKWAFTEDALREYKNEGQNSAIVLARSPAEMDREIGDADGVIGGLSKDQFAKAKNLKWVQTYSAGVEAYRWKEFLESGKDGITIIWAWLYGYYTDQDAEPVIDFAKLTQQGQKLAEYCKANPTVSITKAAEPIYEKK